MHFRPFSKGKASFWGNGRSAEKGDKNGVRMQTQMRQKNRKK